MPPIKINHVAVVVEDIDKALVFWQQALGLKIKQTERNEEEAVEIAFLPVGDGEIELIAPITDEGGIARYLAKTGGGLHHICIEVTDIAASIEQISETGAELINDTPKTREDGTRYVFVHPRSTGGVLLELYERPA